LNFQQLWFEMRCIVPSSACIFILLSRPPSTFPDAKVTAMPPKPSAAAAASSDIDELRALVEALTAEVACCMHNCLQHVNYTATYV
jgi:hypothetical protein